MGRGVCQREGESQSFRMWGMGGDGVGGDLKEAIREGVGREAAGGQGNRVCSLMGGGKEVDKGVV